LVREVVLNFILPQIPQGDTINRPVLWFVSGLSREVFPVLMILILKFMKKEIYFLVFWPICAGEDLNGVKSIVAAKKQWDFY